jgi:hypothetical protein
MKERNIYNKLRDSFYENNPVQSYEEIQTKFGWKKRTFQRKIKTFNLLSSYNRNSKFYTLPELGKFNSYGIWSYRKILFSRNGNLYQTLIYLVTQSKSGYTGKELRGIVQVKTDDALRLLWQAGELKRHKQNSNYVYYAVEKAHFEIQQVNREQEIGFPRTACSMEDKNRILSVLVEIIHQDSLCVKELYTGLKRQQLEVSAYQIDKIINHYELKKRVANYGIRNAGFRVARVTR